MFTNTSTSPATVTDVLRLADAIRLVHAGAKIEWTNEGSGYVYTGVLRHIVDGNRSSLFPRADADVRDTWVRITLVTSGADCWLPTMALADMLATGWAGEVTR